MRRYRHLLHRHLLLTEPQDYRPILYSYTTVRQPVTLGATLLQSRTLIS